MAIFGARLRVLTYAEVQQEFTRKFRKSAPTQANIRLLVNKFQRTKNVVVEPCSGRPSMPEQTLERIREAIERSPQASSCRLSNQLDMPRSTVLKVLKFTPKKKAYHIQILAIVLYRPHASGYNTGYSAVPKMTENRSKHVNKFGDAAVVEFSHSSVKQPSESVFRVVRNELLACRELLQWTEHAVTTGGQVWTIRWMLHNIPSECLQLNGCPVCHIRPAVVIEENHIVHCSWKARGLFSTTTTTARRPLFGGDSALDRPNSTTAASPNLCDVTNA
ncbi:hypothetical protein ANN_13512 [Periplaneta americana]|uniref:DUF4817 domain-containing protein n=1 Tax=Periplaneta americana TaxID=6978 RepID=A0ABQ8TJM2_PERAM|nr:hypothetical protein ANN_13512 [Periplaneta americana]